MGIYDELYRWERQQATLREALSKEEQGARRCRIAAIVVPIAFVVAVAIVWTVAWVV
jgi:hypothetical protein